MKKKTAYFVATITCIAIFILYSEVLAMLELGIFGSILLTVGTVGIIGVTWRGITRKPKRKYREEAVKDINYDKEVLIRIDEEIDIAKKSRGNDYSGDLFLILENHCINKEAALDLIYNYKLAFNKDLIKRLENISNLYSEIKKFIAPFITLGIVEAKYPHKRIDIE
jgi:hypothetical protein